MTVSFSPVFTGTTSNDGTGDSIQTAFIKVNNSVSNIVTAVDALQSTYANTNIGVFNELAVTNQVLGSLYLNSGTIYVNGSPVSTSAITFPGGNVPNQANFNALTTSISANTGAVVIAGGLGIGGNTNIGNNLVLGGNITSGGTLLVSGSTDSSGVGSGAIVTTGGLSVTRSTNLGGTLGVAGATSLASTLGVSGVTTLSSTTVSSSVSNGALVVAGGVGIGGALNVGGAITVANLVVTGTFAANASGVITTPYIDLNTPVNLNPLTQDNFANIGIIMHYYTTGSGDGHAFAGRLGANVGSYANAFAYYSSATDPITSGWTVGRQLGTIVGGSLIAANATASTSATTGALQVVGGAGVAGALYVGSTISAQSVFAGTIGNSAAVITGTYGNIATINATNVNGVIIGNSAAVITGTYGNIATINATNVNGVIIGNSAAVITGTYGNIATVNATNVNVTTVTATNINAATIGNTSAVITGTYGNIATVNATNVNAVTFGNTGAQATFGNITTTNGLFWANGVSYINSAQTATNAVTAQYVTGLTAANVQAVIGSVSTASFPTLNQNTTGTAANLSSTPSIVISGIIPNANASVNIGSTTAWFNNIYGTAIHAQYADLAEIYSSDAIYQPGTVVVFGGEKEITTTVNVADVRVAGVISTNPAYLMNGTADGLPVALRGRVPVMVEGKANKGDLLVTGMKSGTAISIGKDKSYGVAVFAKSLENKTTIGVGLLEAVIL